MRSKLVLSCPGDRPHSRYWWLQRLRKRPLGVFQSRRRLHPSVRGNDARHHRRWPRSPRCEPWQLCPFVYRTLPNGRQRASSCTMELANTVGHRPAWRQHHDPTAGVSRMVHIRGRRPEVKSHPSLRIRLQSKMPALHLGGEGSC